MDPTILAYIAGFLDGDGSIFFQIIRKKDYRLGFQIRSSVAFYQKSENQRILDWLKAQLDSGYIRHRKTGISDYTIVEPGEVRRVLELLEPYVRLKREHVRLGLEILAGMPYGGDAERLLALCSLVDRFQMINYSKKRTVTASVVAEHLGSRGYLAPVETDPLRRESSGRTMAKTPAASAASRG
jgi:LAGLIDADG endonuclease